MTKEEAWEAWLNVTENYDWLCGTDMHKKEAECMFCDGWDAAMDSLKPQKDDIPYNAILQCMNSILQRNFRPTLAHKKLIHARWKEGMREADFEKVCRIKKAQWYEPMMTPYLRPQTLFGTKMDAYLQEPEPKQKKTIMNHLGQLVEVDE